MPVCLQSSVNVRKTVWNSSMALVTDFTSISFPKEKSGKKLHFLPGPSILLLFWKTMKNHRLPFHHCCFFIWIEFYFWPQRNFGLTVCAYGSRFLLLVPPYTTFSYAFQSAHTSHNLDSVVPGRHVQKCMTQCSRSFFFKLMHKYTPAV